MASGIRVDANVPEVLRSLERFKRNQIPFATSLALNTVGKGAREAARKGTHERFIVRRRAFIDRSFTMRASSKSRLFVELGVRDPFLARHEEGGTFRSSKAKALPKAVRSSKARVVPRSKWPGRVRSDPRVFTRRLPSGAVSVVRRMGRRGIERVLWTLVPSVRIKARLRFEETVRTHVARNWEREFGRALSRAIATAK